MKICDNRSVEGITVYMHISGLQKTSLIDYPGKICCIVFTKGCNFRCGFCHNPELVDPTQKLLEIMEEEFYNFLKKRMGILDAVTITGGEPTIHKDLPEFIKKIKKIGFLIKLDTNGTNPEMVKKLLTDKLIDYIAMDIKGPIDKYDKICNSKIDQNNILESINLIMNSGIDYEFRTTIVPTLHNENDFREIGKMIKGAKIYYLQQFRPMKTLNPNFQTLPAYTTVELEKFARIVKKYVKNTVIRGV